MTDKEFLEAFNALERGVAAEMHKSRRLVVQHDCRMRRVRGPLRWFWYAGAGVAVVSIGVVAAAVKGGAWRCLVGLVAGAPYLALAWLSWRWHARMDVQDVVDLLAIDDRTDS